MQILFNNNINNTKLNPNINTSNKLETNNQQIAYTKENHQKVYAKNLNAIGINFKATKSDEEKSLEDLRKEYDWYVNIDKTSPIDAFLKIKTSKKSMNELFINILKDKNASYYLIDSIAGRARDSIKNRNTLKELLGENSPNLYFFMPDNPYKAAFENYMDKKYENARCMESLLKLRPDWKEDVLIKKYEALHGDKNLKIGNLPEEFKNGVFEQIRNHLLSYCQYQGAKYNIIIPPLKIGNRTYNFEYFTQGKTDKNVFGVYTPEKKYVFKMADINKRSLNNPYSLGALALIDSYLTLNNCRNIAPLYFYDHNLNTCIYKYQEHNTVHQKLNSTNEVNYYMPDFKALGMCYNDTIGNDNYFLSDIECENFPQSMSLHQQQKELISVDNDHVTFNSPFMLLLDKYNEPLPNAMQTAF